MYQPMLMSKMSMWLLVYLQTALAHQTRIKSVEYFSLFSLIFLLLPYKATDISIVSKSSPSKYIGVSSMTRFFRRGPNADFEP
jgi:hypothetical protein